MIIGLLLIFLIWFISGLLCYGAEFAYWQNYISFKSQQKDRFYWSNLKVSLFLGFWIALLGPIGILLTYFAVNRFKYGFKYGINDLKDWIKWKIQLAKERKQRRINYVLFRKDVKDGEIDNFENEAREVVK